MKPTLCKGDECQAWRWHDQASAGETRRGYCGAAGDPGEGEVGSGGDILQAKGDLATHDGTNVIRLPAGVDGAQLLANSTKAEGLEWQVSASQTELETKGDILTHSGAEEVALQVGPDNYVLTADSAAPFGMYWKQSLGSAGIVLGGKPTSFTLNTSSSPLQNYSRAGQWNIASGILLR